MCACGCFISHGHSRVDKNYLGRFVWVHLRLRELWVAEHLFGGRQSNRFYPSELCAFPHVLKIWQLWKRQNILKRHQAANTFFRKMGITFAFKRPVSVAASARFCLLSGFPSHPQSCMCTQCAGPVGVFLLPFQLTFAFAGRFSVGMHIRVP